MDLVVKTKKNGSVEEARFDDKEFFISAVEKAYKRREDRNHVEDADRIVKAFASGITVKRKDFGILKRALRRYDEVYLCNELFDLIEESDAEYITVGDEFLTPFDFSEMSV